MMQNKSWELFRTFLRIGAFTFGGGYAMIPLIKREIVETKNWLTQEEMLDVVAIAESSPGPLAINSATFVGKRVDGMKGALCATIGVSLPSFLVILFLAFFLKQIDDIKLVKYAFMGIRAGVLVLILSACVSMVQKMKKIPWNCVLALTAFLMVGFFHISAILVLSICGTLGVLRTIWTVRREK